MARSLPRSTPAEQQADPAAILSLIDALDGHPAIEMHSLMVVRHGLGGHRLRDLHCPDTG